MKFRSKCCKTKFCVFLFLSIRHLLVAGLVSSFARLIPCFTPKQCARSVTCLELARCEHNVRDESDRPRAERVRRIRSLPSVFGFRMKLFIKFNGCARCCQINLNVCLCNMSEYRVIARLIHVNFPYKIHFLLRASLDHTFTFFFL